MPFLPTVICDIVLDYRPLQQGLRQRFRNSLGSQYPVLDYRPLQQGLRLLLTQVSISNIYVELDYRPLQQGLRLTDNDMYHAYCCCTRLSSTTTRIKTCKALMAKESSSLY